MEIYLVKENMEEINHYEFITSTHSLIDINNWIKSYNKLHVYSNYREHDCTKPLITYLNNLRESGKILWYRTDDNIFWYFYDMAHVKNIALLREIKLKSLLNEENNLY
jgi:hypothetical protein